MGTPIRRVLGRLREGLVARAPIDELEAHLAFRISVREVGARYGRRLQVRDFERTRAKVARASCLVLWTRVVLEDEHEAVGRSTRESTPEMAPAVAALSAVSCRA